MSGNINVDPAALAAAASQFGNQSEQLGELIRQVTSSINQLEPAWKSDASISFNDLMVQWNRDVNNIHQALIEVASNVKGAGISYSTLDTDIAKGFR